MEINEILTHNSLNSGCSYGKELLYRAIKKLGLARSIVVDKDNVVLAGDKVLDVAKKIGIKKVQVVEVSGDTLVVVKRNDVSVDSVKGCEIALLDNLAGKEDLEWNTDYIIKLANSFWGFNPINWGGDECVVKEIDIEKLLKEGTKIAPPEKEKIFTGIHAEQKSLFEQ